MINKYIYTFQLNKIINNEITDKIEIIKNMNISIEIAKKEIKEKYEDFYISLLDCERIKKYKYEKKLYLYE